jgi:hypothetical protein
MSDNLPEQYEPQQALEFLERASGQLALILDPIDAVQFVKRAEMVAYWTRAQKAAESVQRDAARLVLAAKRHLGNVLEKTDLRSRGRAPNKWTKLGDLSPSLSDLGISKSEAAEARRVAAVPQAHFDQYLDESEHPTTHGLLSPQDPPKAPGPKPAHPAPIEAYVLLDELWPRIAARSTEPVAWLRRVIEANVNRQVAPPVAEPAAKLRRSVDHPTFFKKGNK